MISKHNIGVLLLNWNNERNISRLVERIHHWKTSPSIIIVDNASNVDISNTLKKTLSKVTVIRNPINGGFAGGNNLGFKYCIDMGFEYIILLNHDANMSEDIVETLLEEIRSKPQVSAIGPCTREGLQKFAGGRNIAHYPATRIPYRSSGPLIREVDYLPGAACILRGSTLETVGVFDERYFFSGEMADLCARMIKQGFSCVVHTGVCITHDTGEDTPMRERIHLYYSVRNRFLYIRKHERFIRFWMLFWIIFGSILAISIMIKGKPHSAKAVILGVRDGMSKKFGNHNDYFIH